MHKLCVCVFVYNAYMFVCCVYNCCKKSNIHSENYPHMALNIRDENKTYKEAGKRSEMSTKTFSREHG